MVTYPGDDPGSLGPFRPSSHECVTSGSGRTNRTRTDGRFGRSAILPDPGSDPGRRSAAMARRAARSAFVRGRGPAGRPRGTFVARRLYQKRKPGTPPLIARTVSADGGRGVVWKRGDASRDPRGPSEPIDFFPTVRRIPASRGRTPEMSSESLGVLFANDIRLRLQELPTSHVPVPRERGGTFEKPTGDRQTVGQSMMLPTDRSRGDSATRKRLASWGEVIS